MYFKDNINQYCITSIQSILFYILTMLKKKKTAHISLIILPITPYSLNFLPN